MWFTEPELFLYSKSGDEDVQVWRCKKPMISSSSSPPLLVPMIPEDFEYVSQVKCHSDLVNEDLLHWDQTGYEALLRYISERHLLVNSQGLVIVELWKSSDGNQMGANAPIYLRSLDIICLEDYISEFMEQPIPLRNVQYLDDINGKAAPVDGGDSTTATKQVVQLQDDLKRERNEKLALAKKVADAKAKNKTLEATNMNLNGTNLKLKQDLADVEAENKTLEAEKMTLKDTNTKLKQDLADAEAKNKTLEAENVNLNGINTKLKQDLADVEAKIKTLEAENMTLKGTNTKLKQDLAARENEVTDLNSKDKASVEKVTKLTEDVAEWKRKFEELESKAERSAENYRERIEELNEEMVMWRKKAKALESKNKAKQEEIERRRKEEQEERERRRKEEEERANRKESWTNDMPDQPKWTGVEGLRCITKFSVVTILGGQGSYTNDQARTNVRAAYWYKVRLHDNVKLFRAVAIRDLAPNREKARFSTANCFTVNSNQGILYVVTYDD